MRRNGGARAKDSQTLPFHYLLQGTAAANVYQFNVQPSSNFGTRVVVEADVWAHFRVKNLKFRLHPSAGSGSAAAGFVGGVQDTLPGTLAQVSELIPSVFTSTDSTVPTEWMTPSAAELAGPFPWYKSVPGGADVTEESIGSMAVWTSGATDVFYLEMRGVFEFKTSVATGNTPAQLARVLAEREARQEALRDRQRGALLAVLATPPRSTSTGHGKTSVSPGLRPDAP